MRAWGIVCVALKHHVKRHTLGASLHMVFEEDLHARHFVDWNLQLPVGELQGLVSCCAVKTVQLLRILPTFVSESQSHISVSQAKQS